MPTFTHEDRARVQENIFRLLAEGASLEDICRVPGWPSIRTLYNWMDEDPNLAALVAHGRRVWRERTTPRHPFDPEAAERLLREIRYGTSVGRLVGRPGFPKRPALREWRERQPEFRALYDACLKVARDYRDRFGPRRSRPRYEEAAVDRLLLAVMRGATLEQLSKDKSFPTRRGIRRWRRAHPEFSGALDAAVRTGRRVRDKARVDPRCTDELINRVADHIINGGSINSLRGRTDLPHPLTLYRWIDRYPEFAQAVRIACEMRNEVLIHEEARLRLAKSPRAGAVAKRLGQLNPFPGEGKIEA
jgi:hypothetical protein